MADPVRCRLRPAIRRGLTRPDWVTAPERPDGHHTPAPTNQEHTGQVAEPVSGELATPDFTATNTKAASALAHAIGR